MFYLVRGIKLAVDDEQKVAEDKLAKKLGLATSDFTASLYRESIDARKGIWRVQQWLVKTTKPLKRKYLQGDVSTYQKPELKVFLGSQKLRYKPVIIGAGPCGLFAALLLAKHGYQPIVIERGADVTERKRIVDHFWQTGQLNTECNVQFGEGGAGTFSDGKLTSRSKDPRSHTVLETLVQYGAPKEILYLQYPHVGTDKLQTLLLRLREDLIAQGTTFKFNCKLENLRYDANEKLYHLELSDGDLKAEAVVLALGHSARDTFRMLYQTGLALESKAFAMGFRIEHKQTLIEYCQYGDKAGHTLLPRASYHLKAQIPKLNSKLGVYSFCMCPGGFVVNASSQTERLTVNGMSYYARAGQNANSAILCSVNDSIYGKGVFNGMEFQEELEHQAYLLGAQSKTYTAPVQLVSDFLKEKPSSQLGAITPTVKPGYVLTDLSELYPEPISSAIGDALSIWEKKMPGFASRGAILTGIEARSSSPVRMCRLSSGESISLPGIYPAGEGAGYAGGIVSAAIDGLKVAETIISRYQPWL